MPFRCDSNPQPAAREQRASARRLISENNEDTYFLNTANRSLSDSVRCRNVRHANLPRAANVRHANLPRAANVRQSARAWLRNRRARSALSPRTHAAHGHRNRWAQLVNFPKTMENNNNNNNLAVWYNCVQSLVLSGVR